MALAIGRRGFIGVGLQSGFQVPAAIADYVDFTNFTVNGVQDSISVDHATSNRDKLLTTIPGKRWSEGDLEMYADSRNAGYFLVAALGTVQTQNLAGSVYRHTITRNNLNTPQYLTITSDRSVDRQIYADLTVDELEFSVGTDLAKLKAKMKGNFPQTTTSGIKTTSSGNIFNFANASFAFGTTISGAQGNTPLKPHDFKLNIKNNADVVFGHSTQTPRSINVKDFEPSVDFVLYFENTTDRDNYYAQNKQAASLVLTGNGIGNGYNEGITFNFYKTSIETFVMETGIDGFYAEKVKLNCEYEPVTGRSIDAVVTNTKSLYI